MSCAASLPASVIRRRVRGSQGVLWPSRVASGRAVLGCRLHRHQPGTSRRTSRRVLQPARYGSRALCHASDDRGRGVATDVRRHPSPISGCWHRPPGMGLVRAQILRATRGEVGLAGKASPAQHSGAANRPIRANNRHDLRLRGPLSGAILASRLAEIWQKSAQSHFKRQSVRLSQDRPLAASETRILPFAGPHVSTRKT
jgi:hypothetical protein